MLFLGLEWYWSQGTPFAWGYEYGWGAQKLSTLKNLLFRRLTQELSTLKNLLFIG